MANPIRLYEQLLKNSLSFLKFVLTFFKFALTNFYFLLTEFLKCFGVFTYSSIGQRDLFHRLTQLVSSVNVTCFVGQRNLLRYLSRPDSSVVETVSDAVFSCFVSSYSTLSLPNIFFCVLQDIEYQVSKVLLSLLVYFTPTYTLLHIRLNL